MKRPRVRISTLMFLIVIAALVVALVLEKRRSAKLLADAQAERARARNLTVDFLFQAVAASKTTGPNAKAGGPVAP
jgi:hypothetical protein